MSTDIKFNPNNSLRSNLENSPAPPLKRLQGLLMQKGETLESYSARLGIGYNRFRRLLMGVVWDAEEARQVADGVGLVVSDIWPDHEEAQAA